MSAEPAHLPAVVPSQLEPPARPAALPMSSGRRLAIVACGYIPFLNIAAVATLLALPAADLWPAWTAWAAPLWLLLVPPLVVRVTLRLRPLSARPVPLDSRAFLLWWFTSQWQVIFNRLPMIEELIRLVPGLYSAWLRLWGAKVGRFVYWTPGLRILDRPLLAVGDRVVFGVAVRINPHIILPDAAGRPVLQAATVRIGNDVLVGGYSTLFAGSWIADGEASPGQSVLRPFGGWSAGRRVKPAGEVTEEGDHQ